MSTLLVQSCSKTKIEADSPVSALDLYSGYFFKIIKKSTRERGEKLELDLCILSAEHGIIDPDEPISPYDRQMDQIRAEELSSEVKKDLKRRIADKRYDRIVINAGKEYRRAIDGFDDDINVETYFIRGEGIGEKGQALKQFLQGEDSVIVEEN